jgi:tripartite-type tricarboxylate transporter receptor subunit TctC
MKSFKRRNVLIAAMTMIAVPLGTASAQTSYPTQTVRILVPYGPGGATDIAARVLAEGLTKELGQPVIVENKAGGSGIVAIQELVKAKPDGHTLLVGNVTTNMLNPLIKKNEMPVDAFKDIVPVTQLVTLPHIMVATKVNFPPNTLQEVVKYAKERPGELNHSSSGFLAYTHIDFLMLQDRAGIKMELVPLQAGAGGGQVDLINGDVQLAITNAATVAPFVQSGQLKAIAVTSDKRLPTLPDVPTFKESGYEGIGTNAWNAMFAPAGVPEDVLKRIHEATLKALASGDVKKKLEDMMFDIETNPSPQAAKEWLQAEVVKWSPVVETATRMVKQ